ncbi:MAG: hypothetical protein AAGE52_08430 [Myxococcota bacterium]
MFRTRCVSLVLGVISALGGCSSDPTQIMVVVRSDLSVPAALDEVRIEVQGFGDQPVASANLRDAPLPRTLALVHRGGALGPIDVFVRGYRGGSEVVARQARSFFEKGEARMLTVWLRQSCQGVDCAGGETCTEAGCDSPEVILADWPGEVPDAGLPDAAIRDAAFDVRQDGGSDAGVNTDSGVDAGVDANVACAPDCESGCVCGSTCSCTIGCLPNQDCDAVCTGGSTCSVEARDSDAVMVDCNNAELCTIDARMTTTVEVRCRNEASCDVDCGGSDNCVVRCRDTSACTLRCAGSSDCNLRGCTPISCPGQVVACNTSCP